MDLLKSEKQKKIITINVSNQEKSEIDKKGNKKPNRLHRSLQLNKVNNP